MSEISPETIDAAIARLAESDVIAIVHRNLPKWRAWFPSEQSSVETARADLLALVTLAEAHLASLAADRAEREERERPIDAQWLGSMFDEEFDEAFSSRSIMLGALVPACGRCGWTWVIDDVRVATVKTRGDVLDLLRILKGGDA